MNRKNKWVWGLMIAITMSLFLDDVAYTKINITDELWREEQSNSRSSEEANSTKTAAHSTNEPVMLDVLDLKNMDILDVLKLISQKSGMNIIAGKNVKGKVTVFLKDIEVREALRIIVESYGWSYTYNDGIMQVMTDKEYEIKHGYHFGRPTETRLKRLLYAKAADVVTVISQMKSSLGKIIIDKNSGILILKDEPEKLDAMDVVIEKIDIPVELKIFTLHYAKAQEISSKIGELLTPSVGTVEFDERSNCIVVSDTASKIEKIQKVITAFDQKDREVLIEAKILQVTLGKEYKLGVDWEGVVADYHNLTLASNFDVLGSTQKRGKVSIGTVASDGYVALLEALEVIGETNILSAPRIMTVNNKEAKILVGSTEPYVTTTTTTPASGPITTAESISFIDVGVKLFVTPTIHEDDFITMKIRPEVSSVTNNLTTSNNNTIPIVETSQAETTVNVKDGVSVIIGGLIKEETIKASKKVPLLGNIPVLGMAFRSKSDSTSKTEIVIFITPKIISGDVGVSKQLVAF